VKLKAVQRINNFSRVSTMHVLLYFAGRPLLIVLCLHLSSEFINISA
jgi:hypothetical protein